MQPYPYARWPRYRRDEAALLTRVSAHAALGPSVMAALDAAAELLGAPLDTALGVPELWTSAQLAQHLPGELAAVVFVVREGARDRAIALEVSRELVAAVCDRALGGDARVLAPGEPLDPLELGVLGYVVVRCAAHTRGVLRVADALGAPDELLAALALPPGERALVLPIRVALGDTHGHCRLFTTAWPERARSRRAPDVPQALCGLPVTLCAHAAAFAIDAGELAALEPGDIVFPDRTMLEHARDGWRGQLELHALGASGAHVLMARIEAGQLVLEGTASMRAPRAEGWGRRMDDTPVEEAEGEGLARSAPVELCLELARFVVPLEELLALRPGAVWSTGRAIGERVTLTAAGRSVAHGELVDVEGEIGVRILERV